MSAKDDTYGIEPEDEGPESPPPASPSSATPREKSVHALDICPNCGAPMRGRDSLVCLRCGYDLKTMRVVKTKTGETTVADEPDEPDEPAPPLAQPGGPGWLPTALLAAGLFVMAVATLAGWRGLFPAAEEAIPFGERLQGLVRLPVVLAVWTTCVMTGLTVVAWLNQRALGDLPLALGRAAGISAVAMTVMLLRLPWRFGEVAAECVAATIAILALTFLVFRLTPRDAGKTALFALVAFIVVVVGARLVIWAV